MTKKGMPRYSKCTLAPISDEAFDFMDKIFECEARGKNDKITSEKNN